MSGSASYTHGHSHHHACALPHDGEYVESPAVDTPEKEDIVFCDPVAFRYLEDDPCATVVSRRNSLSGYEIYLVEQWACSRINATFVIATYTGDPSHLITVSVLRIPRNDVHWSLRLKAYFKAVKEYSARPKHTELGTLMVTNLSSFPSALTVVLVPGGDVRDHWTNFIVNENLKRMGCSGRSALSLTAPTDASQTKFYQLFKTSDRIPFGAAVVEQVRLCQLALAMFGTFDPRYPDGLLCDVTEKSIRDWWAEFGSDIFNAEPNDGTLGPMTVAALLGLLCGSRNRLSLCGAPVPKDAFDLPQLGKAVEHFQRQQRMKAHERSGRLDRVTLDKLHRATQRGGPSDRFAVPRAIRSTVADLSARAVGSSSGPIDVTLIETTSIERFVQHISGASCKYLWLGKPRKTPTMPVPSRRNSTSTGEEEPPQPIVPPGLSRESTYDTAQNGSDLPKAVFRTVTGKMKDVASAGADYVRGRGSGNSGPQRSFTKEDSVDRELQQPLTIVPQQTRTAPSPLATATPSPQGSEPPSSGVSATSTHPSTRPSPSPPHQRPTLIRARSVPTLRASRPPLLRRSLSFSLVPLSWTLPFPPTPCRRLAPSIPDPNKYYDHLSTVATDLARQVDAAAQSGEGEEVERTIRRLVEEAEGARERGTYERGVVEGKVRDLEELVRVVGRRVRELEGEVTGAGIGGTEEEERRRGWWFW